MIINYRLCLVGFGNVGKAFARLLLKKKSEMAEKYNLSFSVTGIITGSHGRAIDPTGLDLEEALNLVESGLNHQFGHNLPVRLPCHIKTFYTAGFTENFDQRTVKTGATFLIGMQ